MTAYYAHSPDEKRCAEAQRYEDHVYGVRELAMRFAEEVSKYAKRDAETLKQTVALASEYHDLGKLAAENQEVLNGDKKADKSLPINHVDAGTAYFLKQEKFPYLVASVIQAHHRGYIDFIELKTSENEPSKPLRDKRYRNVVDESLDNYITIHNSLVNNEHTDIPQKVIGNGALFRRVALSCLVDADHTNTSIHYGEYPKEKPTVELNPSERLKKLDEYVGALSKNANSDDVRVNLRKEMYAACKDSQIENNIACCAAPVGTGKTTAIIAHLLKQADRRGLRRIFVILPFTNIIKQSVDVYGKALVLQGENPEDVVAELHHKADFDSVDSRHLTALWRAPIIVTTAVTFFETLASNTTSTLRRLHELPGSAIFIDESHAALPVKFLPLAWRWIYRYAEEWGCYFLLASGSLTKFWEIENIKIKKGPDNVPEIIENELHERLSVFETKRIEYKCDLNAKNCQELAQWITGFEGPRLVIMNTVQSAAILADYFAKTFGRDRVEHLSAALTPIDRDKTLKWVKARLEHTNNYKTDYDWTFIATSCVEAGVDLSFKFGFREIGSTVSLLQTAGRVSRNGEYGIAEIWSFKIKEGDLLKTHPMLKDSANILSGYFERGVTICPSLSTESIKDEIILSGKTSAFFKKLVTAEKHCSFPTVEKEFKVIANDTRLVVVDKVLAEKIKNFEKVDWQELQKKSVQIWGYKLDKLKIDEIRDGIYEWKFEYNNFIGYMAGLLAVKRFELGEATIL